jgi:hypothetical protein
VSICRRLGSLVRNDSRVDGNMDIWWSPSFQSDRVWFANENGCDTLRLPRILCNSGFLATNMYTMDDKNGGTKNWAPTTNSSARFPKSGIISLLTQQGGKSEKSGTIKSNCYW